MMHKPKITDAHMLEVSESVNRTKTNLLLDMVAMLKDESLLPEDRIQNALLAFNLATSGPRCRKAPVNVEHFVSAFTVEG
jgi:hypothetical protein